MDGVPEPRMSLRDRVARGPAYSVSTGGLSDGSSAPSPIQQSGYGQSTQTAGQQAHRITDGYQGAPGWSNGTTMAPARLVQRINPQTVWRGGARKPYEGGGP